MEHRDPARQHTGLFHLPQPSLSDTQKASALLTQADTLVTLGVAKDGSSENRRQRL